MPRAQRLRGLLKELAGAIPSSQLVPLPTRRRDRWVRGPRCLDQATPESIRKFAVGARAAPDRAPRAVARQRYQAFRDCVHQQAALGCGGLHRSVRDATAEVSELRIDGQTSWDAASVMEAKARVW
eukprot:1558610-Pyramimonas_sp.AAC.1